MSETGANREIEEEVFSPCINICTLDEAKEYCLGCCRHVDDIRHWKNATVEEKKAILAAALARQALQENE